MGALRALAGMVTRNNENPADPITLSGASVGDLWSPAPSGDPTNIATALRCVSILAGTVSGLPLKASEIKTRDPIDVPALDWVVRDMDGDVATRMEIIEMAVGHLVLRGNAFLRKWRDSKGRVQRLVPIHPRNVEVRWNGTAAQTGRPVGKYFIVGGSERLTPREIMHVHILSENGVTGISPITKARTMFDIAANVDQTALTLAQNGPEPAGVLSTDVEINAEQAQQVKERWISTNTGPKSAGVPAVLGKGLQFQAIDMTPEDLQFLEQRKFSTTEIARFFGIPGWMIGDQEKSTSWGTGMEQMFRSWVILTVKPLVQRFEQRFRLELLEPVTEKVEFELSGLMRGDSQTRAAFYQSGIVNGWLVPNEVRELEDLAPVPWGDENYRPYTGTDSEQKVGADDDAS